MISETSSTKLDKKKKKLDTLCFLWLSTHGTTHIYICVCVCIKLSAIFYAARTNCKLSFVFLSNISFIRFFLWMLFLQLSFISINSEASTVMGQNLLQFSSFMPFICEEKSEFFLFLFCSFVLAIIKRKHQRLVCMH